MAAFSSIPYRIKPHASHPARDLVNRKSYIVNPQSLGIRNALKLPMVVAALIVGAGVVIELCAILKAPLGYQDETGFHIGAQSADEDTRLWQNPG